jgi:hypothetical protein
MVAIKSMLVLVAIEDIKLPGITFKQEQITNRQSNIK